MPDLVFVDTNVFAYALDASDAGKQARAHQVIDERRRSIVVSTQVLIELHAVCTRKLGMTRTDARAAIEPLGGFPTIDSDRALVLQAMALAEQAELSIFDAAIVCAARRAGCQILLTEDLNAGQAFGELVVENPFRLAGG